MLLHELGETLITQARMEDTRCNILTSEVKLGNDILGMELRSNYSWQKRLLKMVSGRLSDCTEKFFNF